MMKSKSDSVVQVRNFKLYTMGLLAVFTCPCHIPLYVFLLSGTVAGTVLSNYQWYALGIFTVVFSLLFVATIKEYRQRQAAKGDRL